MSMSIVGSVAMSGIGGADATSGASMRMPANQKMADLFSRIDTSGSGAISRGQLQQAFQTMNPPGVFKAFGADATWQTLDPNNTGSVSQQDFVTGMKSLMSQLRNQTHAGGAGSSTTLLNSVTGSGVSTLA